MSNDDQLSKLFNKLPSLAQQVLIHMENGYRPLDAYILAGGTAETRKSAQDSVRKLLATSAVAEYRLELSKRTVNTLQISREEVIARLAAIARARLDDIIRIEKICVGYTDQGEPMYTNKVVAHDTGEIPDDALAAMAEVSQNEYGIKLKMHSPLVAIKQLCEMNGWDAPKAHEIKGIDGATIKLVTTSAAEAAATYQDLMRG